MLPYTSDDLQRDFTVAQLPGKTFGIDFERNRIGIGFIDGLDAVKQAIFLILNTQRYVHGIFSWNYGSELSGLMGCPVPLVYSRIKTAIAQALIQDDRITGVDNFEFTRDGSNVHVTFHVTTTAGDVTGETEVTI